MGGPGSGRHKGFGSVAQRQRNRNSKSSRWDNPFATKNSSFSKSKAADLRLLRNSGQRQEARRLVNSNFNTGYQDRNRKLHK